MDPNQILQVGGAYFAVIASTVGRVIRFVVIVVQNL